MRLRLGNEADCLDLQHTELRSRLPCTPHAWPEPPTARAVSFNDCLGALHFANSESDRVTGFEKVIWPEWVESVSVDKESCRWIDLGRQRQQSATLPTKNPACPNGGNG
jgi:hypothetical protein